MSMRNFWLKRFSYTAIDGKSYQTTQLREFGIGLAAALVLTVVVLGISFSWTMLFLWIFHSFELI